MRTRSFVVILLLLTAFSFGQNSSLAPIGKNQWFDSNGKPCAGCKLYTYAAGTSNALATYNDADLAAGHANTNPVVLDAAGRATVYLTAASYKFILKTSADATIWTQDAIRVVGQVAVADLASTASGKGDELIGYLASGAGATARTVHAVLADLTVNAKDYGATGDGVTDDTASIAAAITAAQSLGASVFLPPGTYVTTNVLTLPAGVGLYSQSRSARIVTALNSHDGINLGSNCTVRSIVLEGANVERVAGGGADGIDSSDASNVLIEDCEIKKWGSRGIATGAAPINWRIRANYVHENFDEGIFLWRGGYDNFVEGNHVISNQYNGIDTNCTRTIIRGNVVRGNGAAEGVGDMDGIMVKGITSYDLAYVIVEGNEVYSNFYHGISVNGADSNVQGVIIRGNTVALNGQGGIWVQYQFATGNIIAENQVRGQGGSGIGLDSCSDNSVIGNQVWSNGGNGIHVGSEVTGSDRNIISANRIKSNTGVGLNVAAGPLGTTTNTFLHGNLSTDNSGGNLTDGGTSTTNSDNVAP